MKKIISVLVENKAGVLARIAGLFGRRGFNIASLTVGETEDSEVSRMTIVATGDDREIEQVEKQLNKQIDIIKVKTLETELSTRRELMLVKVNAVDISPSTLTLELSDRPERLDLLISMLDSYGIAEMARTGMVALGKGAGAIAL